MNIQHVIDLLNQAGLYKESSVVLAMVQQNKDMLEALKGMIDLYDTDDGTRSLPQYIAARDLLHAETVKRMSEAQCIDFDKEMIDDIAKRLFSIWTSPCSSKETWKLEASLAYDAADAFMAERAKRLKGGV